MPTGVPGVNVLVLGDPGVVVFAIVDRIPPDYLSRAVDLFHGLIRQGHRRFILDLAETQHISSSGAGLAVYYHKVLSELKGRLVVVQGAPSIMEKVGAFLKPVMPIAETREEAIAWLRAGDRTAVRENPLPGIRAEL